MLYIIEFVVFVKKILKYLYKLRFGKKNKFKQIQIRVDTF